MERLAARFGVHYSWVVAATTFLVMLVTAGAVGAPGVLIEPLQWEFGWSTAQISVAFAVRLVLFGLMGPFAAAFMNYFGLRKVAAFALTLIAAGIFASFAMQKLWHLVLLWGVVVGLGTGMTAMVLAATVASRWFVHRRGLVVGLLTASTATGQLVFLPAPRRAECALGLARGAGDGAGHAGAGHRRGAGTDAQFPCRCGHCALWFAGQGNAAAEARQHPRHVAVTPRGAARCQPQPDVLAAVS